MKIIKKNALIENGKQYEFHDIININYFNFLKKIIECLFYNYLFKIIEKDDNFFEKFVDNKKETQSIGYYFLKYFYNFIEKKESNKVLIAEIFTYSSLKEKNINNCNCKHEFKYFNYSKCKCSILSNFLRYSKFFSKQGLNYGEKLIFLLLTYPKFKLNFIEAYSKLFDYILILPKKFKEGEDFESSRFFLFYTQFVPKLMTHEWIIKQNFIAILLNKLAEVIDVFFGTFSNKAYNCFLLIKNQLSFILKQEESALVFTLNSKIAEKLIDILVKTHKVNKNLEEEDNEKCRLHTGFIFF